ncbi:MAG: hypothetical protein VX792_04460 [Candidatus Latescibacterota bacterium]|nr:hypothetical protein [Candidatus Latescibacterota bacterium]
MISTETVAGVISLGAISMSVSCIIEFSKEVRKFLPKLTEVEHKLNRSRDSMENRQSTVAELSELSELISPLIQRESNLQSYYEEMRGLTLKLEREQFISEQSEKGEKDLNIQHNMVEAI